MEAGFSQLIFYLIKNVETMCFSDRMTLFKLADQMPQTLVAFEGPILIGKLEHEGGVGWISTLQDQCN